jgi:hypothetical protein
LKEKDQFVGETRTGVEMRFFRLKFIILRVKIYLIKYLRKLRLSQQKGFYK